MSVVLEVKQLTTNFNLRDGAARAVDHVSFSLEQGECLGIVGESGCGKSTTGLSLMRLLPPVGHVVDGQVLLNGKDLLTLSEHEMRMVRGHEMAMVFQDPMTSLNPTMTIGRQVAEPLEVHLGASKRAAMARALEVLELVGLPNPRDRLNDYPHQLSGGLRQRVVIATALALEPKVLIADEPTTALDVTIQAQILDLLDRLRAELSMAVILVTHDMGVIAERTDRVVVMYAGRAVEISESTDLFRRTRHPYAKALLRAIPRLDDDRRERLYVIPGRPPNLSNEIVGCSFAPRCERARDDCQIKEPELLPMEPSHFAACFHPVLDDLVSSQEVVGRRDVSGMDIPRDPTKAKVEIATSDPHGQEAKSAVLLAVNHLTKEFPVGSGSFLRRNAETLKAVSDVSFAIREGETFGLVGESGCGKTTLGRLVVALDRPTSGSIDYDGADIGSLRGATLRNKRRDMQLVFQDPYASLDPRMRIGSILKESFEVQGIGTRAQQWARINSLVHEVGLNQKALEMYPHEFSGGQRQRIGLARALSLNPRLVVADEPVSALDVSIQAQILNLMKYLQRKHKLTYLIISHDLAVVRYVANTIGVMYLGKLVEVGPSFAIYNRPAHPYTSSLLAAIPIPDPDVRFREGVPHLKGELPSAIFPPSGCRFRTRCPLAEPVCAEEEPPLRVFGPGHAAACHRPLVPSTNDEPPAGVHVSIATRAT
ncbi:ABC transporter ATP-binding protein [Ferrimicrobium sp.]|uniref:ABC transporter ATP-binding protein n=1 Tax=Ferrimicrobium sp. TaxID=2926050 RepID=UPI00261BFD5E|nr:ABC transporter ATP-binding protein [Ferrimicrobium sp.]